MKQALALAEKGRFSVSPNPMVGACVVSRGKLVGSGFHEKFGGPHAEPNALAKAGKKAKGGEFGSMVDDAEEAGTPASVTGTSQVKALDALLLLQGEDGLTPEEAAKKAKRRAIELLDHLDKIRIGLLTGELKQSTIEQLSRTIFTHRGTVMDPKLSEILDEVDLRAQIELAKLGKY